VTAIEPDRVGLTLQPETITTLVGPIDAELAALTAAVAVSYRTGHSLLPGFVPAGPAEVTLHAYAGQWIEWKTLMADIADAASIARPLMTVLCPREPLVERLAAPRDPDVEECWDPLIEVEVIRRHALARAEGRSDPPHLSVVFDTDAAAGHSGDVALRRLYDSYRGLTALMVARRRPHEAGAVSAEAARAYGPVIELPDNLHYSVRWRDLLARVTGGDMAERASEERDLATDGVPRRSEVELPLVRRRPVVKPAEEEMPEMLEEARAFFAIEGIESMRALLWDGSSVASQRLKELARCEGISAGRLWKAARWLDREASLANGGPGVLYGHAATWQWREVNTPWDGHFLVRHLPGAFSRTIRESGSRMKSTFSHGTDADFGFRSLGPIVALREDTFGVFYEVALIDTDYCRDLAQGLRDGQYGSSITYKVTAETLNKDPGRSPWNPEGLPELTNTEVRMSEFGPCRHPADPATSAGIRAATPIFQEH
jgi:hypothetical protein